MAANAQAAPLIAPLRLQLFPAQFQVAELGKFLAEIEADRAGGAVTMFGNHQISDVLAVRVLIVIVLAIDEHDHVGILLNRVMHNEIVGNKIMIRRNGQVVNVIDAIRLNRRDLIPKCVAAGCVHMPGGVRP